MGATNFVTTGHGKDVNSVYKNLVEEAKDEYGRDAHNGSISTTNGYRPVPGVNAVVTRDDLDQIIDQWHDSSEKWGKCWYVELAGEALDSYRQYIGDPNSKDRVFVFFGWAAT